MYEGRNINKKMNLRAQLNSTKLSKGESIQDYLTRVSQFKEKIEAMTDYVDEYELVMTSLDSLIRPWDSFIQTMCSKKKIMKFDIVWEDCIQEEARVSNREALLKKYDQALATHTKGVRIQSNFKKEIHKESQPPKKFQRTRGNNQRKNYSNFQCFNCNKIGHIARSCPLKKEECKKKKKKTSCTSIRR